MHTTVCASNRWYIHVYELLIPVPTGRITCRYEMAVGSTWKLRWVETRNEIPDIINIARIG